MSLFDRIQNDLKESMKAKDQVRTGTLRSILAVFKNAKVAGTGEPTEDDYVAMVKKQAKQRKESIAQFEEHGRDDLAATEKEELVIIEEYLPEEMSAEQIKEIVVAKQQELGVVDKGGMGQLMGAVMKEVGGNADGALVKSVVESVLN